MRHEHANHGASTCLLCIGLSACASGETVVPADAQRLADRLAAVEQEPTRAAELCAPLATPSIRHDCMLHGVERLARRAPDAAATICATMPAGVDADECYFQVAERSGESARCAAAGRFAEDCRMHAWTAVVPSLAGPTDRAGQWEESIATAAAELGFAESDARPWVAAARFVLGREIPLDRSFCEAWAEPRRSHCRVAGRDLFHDRINHVRDARKWDCAEAPPGLLSFAPDEELEAIWRVRSQEICP